MRTSGSILWMALVLGPGAAWAVDSIEVRGLFSGKAVIVVDGQRYVLGVGESTPEGVRLIESDTQAAILEVDGQQGRYPLGGRIGTSYRQRQNTSVRVYRDTRGMFTTVGSINGQTVSFLVDTGATAVAMSAVRAKGLGIPFRLRGTPTQVTTASGVSPGWRLTLDSVKVGAIELTQVDAIVVDGNKPDFVLLGMSFLGRLNTRNQGQVMVLEERF
ncbi:MAG: TIGR02281 family clan AA aspartic protease [Chromatiales bacterium]